MSVQSMAIAVLLVSFLVMILLRFPIAYAVALSSLLCLLSQGLPLTTICQQMVKGISSFSSIVIRDSRFVNEFHILKATCKFCTRLSTFVMTFPFFPLLL